MCLKTSFVGSLAGGQPLRANNVLVLEHREEPGLQPELPLTVRSTCSLHSDRAPENASQAQVLKVQLIIQ